MNRRGLLGIPWLWVLFWFVVIAYVVNSPQAAAANSRSLLGGLQGLAESFVTFVQALAG